MALLQQFTNTFYSTDDSKFLLPVLLMLDISFLLKQCLTLKVFACLECLMKLFLNHFTFSHAKALLIYCWISIFHCGLVLKLDQDSWKLSNLWLKFERIGCLWSEWTNQMRLHKDASKEKGIMVLAYAVFIIYGGNKARRNLHITGTTTWKKKNEKMKKRLIWSNKDFWVLTVVKIHRSKLRVLWFSRLKPILLRWIQLPCNPNKKCVGYWGIWLKHGFVLIFEIFPLCFAYFCNMFLILKCTADGEVNLEEFMKMMKRTTYGY